MEKLQQPFNPCLVGEDLEVGCWLEEFVKYEDYSYNNNNNNHNNEEYSFPSLEDKMPFLQMLQTIEETPSPPQQQHQQQLLLPNISFMQESNNYFQLLLSIQHQKMIINNYSSNNIGAVETVKSESCFKEEEKLPQVLPQQCNNNNSNNTNNSNNGNKKGQGGTKRKRKRPVRPTKNQEEVETQRRTHIAVERNRRRQMNDHLNALRSLMPASYVQRGDQASIIGGAIDFVKEMEQLLESLQAQKRMRQQSETENTTDIISASASSSTSSSPNFINNMFLTTTTSPFEFRKFSPTNNDEPNANSSNANNTEEFSAENRSALADIKVVVIQNHVNLKIQCQRRPGQLLKAIVAFEELRLTILHLNITSLHPLVHYSFNLKIEDDCKLGTADEVVRAVHHIFSLINLS